jgi:hypothetical protein
VIPTCHRQIDELNAGDCYGASPRVIDLRKLSRELLSSCNACPWSPCVGFHALVPIWFV